MRAAIVLAAGRSRRFGRGDKLLAILNGKPLLLHALDRARASGAPRIYVVVSSAGAARLARGHGAATVRARDAVRGLSSSLAAGLCALRPIEREILIFLGDMPFATTPRALRLGSGSAGARPFWRGEPGHPLLIRTSAAKQAAQGDRGLGALGRIVAVPGRSGNVLDIDSRAALRAARFGSRVAPRALTG